MLMKRLMIMGALMMYDGVSCDYDYDYEEDDKNMMTS